MTEEYIKLLVRLAAEARSNAYAPYSKYLVGAAAIVPSGNIYTGCNIENASYPLGNCAERVAVAKAVSDGQRHIEAIAIVGGTLEELGENRVTGRYAYPCGACRQVLSEFLPESGDILVVVARSEDDYEVHSLKKLIPYSFELK